MKPIELPLAGRVKLEDVAREASVSPATVSRVLNHPQLVRPEVRAKVTESIAKLSYTRDSAGRALKSRRMRTVGAVVPTLGISIFAEGVEALQNRLSEHGYTLLIANAQYDRDKELREIRNLMERGVDGLVLVGDAQAPGVHEMLRQSGMPYVTTYICRARSGVPAIGIDNEAATFALTRRLLDLGHTRFGIVANVPASNDRSQARLRGVRRALSEAGHDVPTRKIVKARHSLPEGRLALRILLRDDPSITAIICTTDTLAIGVIAEAKALGLAIPGHLSVTGFDDMEVSSQIDPTLTTIGIPTALIGEGAADTIVGLIERQALPNVPELPTRIMMRGSTGPVRAMPLAISARLGPGDPADRSELRKATRPKRSAEPA